MQYHLKGLVAIVCAVVVQGCATYGQSMSGVMQDVQSGQYQASEAKLAEVMAPNGKDGLLYYLELGVIRHLDGNYEGSNNALEQAERLAEFLETTSVSNAGLSMMTNARQANYAGAEHEKIYINYYKALNYLALAEQATTDSAFFQYLDGARIESRRLIIKLNALRDEEGTYAERNEDEETLFAKLQRLFDAVNGNAINANDLSYRDDALAHYLTAVSFEMNGEYDDARISYRKAAEAYENGYAEQFRLGDEIIEQAWFDTLRVMKKRGGYVDEIRRLSANKLSLQRQQELADLDTGLAQVLVIEHKGQVPALDELNIQMTINPQTQAIELSPYLLSTDYDAWAWFYLMYADRGAYKILTTYLNGVHHGMTLNPFTKTILLGPAWSIAESVGLPEALQGSTRVTVPFYRPQQSLPESRLTVKQSGNVSQLHEMHKAANPTQVAIQQRILNASGDLEEALIRASIKAVGAQGIAGVIPMGGLLGKLAAQASEAADTRSWGLLPSDIRISRVYLPAGKHELVLSSKQASGSVSNHRKTLELEAGELKLWQVRTFDKGARDAQGSPQRKLANAD